MFVKAIIGLHIAQKNGGSPEGAPGRGRATNRAAYSSSSKLRGAVISLGFAVSRPLDQRPMTEPEPQRRMSSAAFGKRLLAPQRLQTPRLVAPWGVSMIQ